MITKELWLCMEGAEWEFFDSEETARLAYKKWCMINQEEFDEEIFKMCYRPFRTNQDVTIWTKDTLDEYIPS